MRSFAPALVPIQHIRKRLVEQSIARHQTQMQNQEKDTIPKPGGLGRRERRERALVRCLFGCRSVFVRSEHEFDSLGQELHGSQITRHSRQHA